MSHNHRCSTCIHFDPILGTGNGYCRAALPHDMGIGVGNWPIVKAERDWCARHPDVQALVIPAEMAARLMSRFEYDPEPVDPDDNAAIWAWLRDDPHLDKYDD